MFEGFLPKFNNKVSMATLITFIQPLLEILTSAMKQDSKWKHIFEHKKKAAPVENSMEYTKKH